MFRYGCLKRIGFNRIGILGTVLSLLCVVPNLQAETRVNEEIDKFSMRSEIFKRYPGVYKALTSNTNIGFGGAFSHAIANHMYSRTDQKAIDDAYKMLEIESHGEKTWFLRFPFVNVAVFETEEGLVVVDAGYAPAGPALLDALREISDKPVHTLIITHHHADHGYGAWKLLESGADPQIITVEGYLSEIDIDTKLANHALINLNNQEPTSVPRSRNEAILPNRTFRDRLVVTIGGEEFVLHEARGETVDHLWVHAPARQVVVSGDLWQPFLLNAGNGKRRQRYASDWAAALRSMVEVKPNLVLPMHGAAMTSFAEAEDKLGAAADMLEAADRQVIDGLNAGLRQDQIIDSLVLPEHLQGRADMAETYNRFADVGKTVLKEYNGWWDGVPSHYTPSSYSDKAEAMAKLAGGRAALIKATESLIESNPAVACYFADMAYYAWPTDREVISVALDAYAARITPDVPTQELTAYLTHMTELMTALNKAGD